MKKWILGAVIMFIAVVPAVLVVFTQIRYSRIRETEAETIVAGYLDSRIEGNPSSALVIHCTGQKPMKVLWDCATVADALKSVGEGEELTVKIHPRGQYVISIRCGERTILSFDSSLRSMRTERNGFLMIALACYLLLILLWISPFLQKRAARHRSDP